MVKTKIEQAIQIPNELIMELLTPSEKRMVKQRMFIIKLLKKGLAIRAIAKEAKVGTDTVTRISKMYNFSRKLKNYFNEKETGFSSKWVFGQNEE